METVKKALIEAMKDAVFHDIIKEHMSAAVSEAMAERDARISALEEELRETKQQLNTLEQYSRRLCINVSNIPEGGVNESTDQLVIDTAKLAGVTVTKGDLDRTHRVGAAKPGKTRNIVARFVTFAKRQEVYDARKKLRDARSLRGLTVTPETAAKIFISDSLTRENEYIMYRARQFRKEKKLFAAWTDVGKLKIRLHQNGPTRVIHSLSELTQLVETQRGGIAATHTNPDDRRPSTRQTPASGTRP